MKRWERIQTETFLYPFATLSTTLGGFWSVVLVGLEVLCPLGDHFFFKISMFTWFSLERWTIRAHCSGSVAKWGRLAHGRLPMTSLSGGPGRATSIQANERPAISLVPGMILFSRTGMEKEKIPFSNCFAFWSCFALKAKPCLFTMNSCPGCWLLPSFPYHMIHDFWFLPILKIRFWTVNVFHLALLMISLSFVDKIVLKYFDCKGDIMYDQILVLVTIRAHKRTDQELESDCDTVWCNRETSGTHQGWFQQRRPLLKKYDGANGRSWADCT